MIDMNSPRIVHLVLAFSLVSASAMAHFIWLEIDPDSPNSLRLRFAEEILEPTPHDMQQLAAPMRVRTADGTPIELVFGEHFMSGDIASDVASVIGTLDYGVLDRTEAGRGVFMLKYHARAARDAEAASKAGGLPVDVTATVADGHMLVTVYRNGSPVEGVELEVILPHQLETAQAETNAEGTAKFSIRSDDWVAIRAMVAEDETGEFGETPYERVHHYSTLTFFYEGEESGRS